MKIVYKFADGTRTEVEVDDELRITIFEEEQRRVDASMESKFIF